MICMFVVTHALTNPYVEILTPKDDGMGRGGLWECSGQVGRDLMNEISVLIKDPTESLPPWEDAAGRLLL